jgi:hypothetical protein
MKKALIVSLFMIVLIINACTPWATAISAPLPVPTPSAAMETQTPIPVALTEVNPSTETKLYTNDLFGLSFQYPSSWYRPSEYVSDRSLRVEVGSDVVYPYGERPEQVSSVKNSYNVVIQYTKNNQNPYWKDTYQTLLNLRDGESLSGARSLLIRVKQLNIGRFKGFEYIRTLSETAQTDYFYTRSIMVIDEQTNNLLTVMGQPYNVEFNNGEEWRDAYRTIDHANLTIFQELIESIKFED